VITVPGYIVYRVNVYEFYEYSWGKAGSAANARLGYKLFRLGWAWPVLSLYYGVRWLPQVPGLFWDMTASLRKFLRFRRDRVRKVLEYGND